MFIGSHVALHRQRNPELTQNHSASFPRTLRSLFVLVGVALLVSLSAFADISIDARVAKDRSFARSTISTPLFSTRSGQELLLAFIATDGGDPRMTVQGVTGAGLNWILVARSNTQLGTAEIWRAFAPSPLSNVNVSANLSQSVAASLVVVSFKGVDTTGVNGAGAIGAVAATNSSSAPPKASLLTRRTGSLVFGVGNDWDSATERTVGGGQSLVHEYLASVQDTYWVQRVNTASISAGTVVTINDLAPDSDRYNLSIVEILPASTSISPLAITSQTLPDGKTSNPYSTSLSATGGASPYNWSTAAGTLPPGLSLSSGGMLSGMPGTSGIFSFTAQVKDTRNQVATKALNVNIQPNPTPTPNPTATATPVPRPSATPAPRPSSTPAPHPTATPMPTPMPSPTSTPIPSPTATPIPAPTSTPIPSPTPTSTPTPPPLSIVSASLPGGTVGTSFSANLNATGGSAPYTWRVTSGMLPSGLAMQSSGNISGNPSSAGSFSFTAQVADVAFHTASALFSINILPAQSAGNTWYVRPDGGTAAQCTGKTDAAYLGTGSSQPCAFSNPHYLWGNDVPGETASWKIAGGDTVIIRNGSYRIGYKGPNIGDSWGQCQGDPFDCGPPPIPSGTSSQHTRILGENFANCTAKPELHGGYGLYRVISLEGSSNVDLQCLEITDHASCGTLGTGNNCQTNFPLDDYARFGIFTNTGTKNVNLTDLNIHGLAHEGIHGPLGGGIVATRVRIAGNVSSGWDFDDGNATQTTGTVTMSYVTVEWNGCAEQYPAVGTYDHCYDDNSGGYGDGVGTPDTGGIFLVDHSTFRYNTQDGLDLLHVDQPGAVITITNSTGYGNMGNQIKQGATTATFQNNVVIGNCTRMQSAFAPNPSTYNANLSDFCRAGGAAVLIGTNDNAHGVIQNNSVTSNWQLAFLLQCLAPGGGTGNCTAAAHINFDNNLIFGFPDLSGGHSVVTAIFQQFGSSDFLSNPGGSRRNNLIFNTSDSCGAAPAVNEVCRDPQLASETDINNFDFHLTSGSPAIKAGINLFSTLTPDYDGKGRPAPPTLFDIGAFQF